MGSATLTMSRREGFLRRVLLVGADFLEDVNKGLEAYLQSARENAIQRTTSAAPSTVRATTEEVTERLASLFHNASQITTTTGPTTIEEVSEGLESLSQNTNQIPVPVSARTPVWSVDKNEFVRRTTETPPPAVSWDESEVVIFMLVISFLLIVVAGLAIQCYVIRMIEKRKKLRSQTVTSSAGDAAAPHVALRVNLPSVPVAVGTPSPPSYEEPPAYHTLSIERMEDHCAGPDKKPRVNMKSKY